MGPYAGEDYNITLCPLQSRLKHIAMGNPMPESTLTLCQSRLHPAVRDLGFGLCIKPGLEISLSLSLEINHVASNTFLTKTDFHASNRRSILSVLKFRKKWSPIWSVKTGFLSKDGAWHYGAPLRIWIHTAIWNLKRDQKQTMIHLLGILASKCPFF